MAVMCGNRTNKDTLLKDNFGRIHNYLRISITDACNFTCTYCMPNKKQCPPTTQMTALNISNIAGQFVCLGVNKIRLTGGEPLLRKDLTEILNSLSALPVELALTTNGRLLDLYFPLLKSSKLRKINISLDSLRSEIFKNITGRNDFDRVYSNILEAIKLGFNVKLNAVIIKGVNDSEINDFAQLSIDYPISVRFIEFMPFRDNNWSFESIIRTQEIVDLLKQTFPLDKISNSFPETADNYRIKGAKGNIGFISTVSNPFCNSCNRIRITSDGKLKTCLLGTNEIDLLSLIRTDKDIKPIIQQAIATKLLVHDGNNPFSNNPSDGHNRTMYSIGG